MTRVCFERIMHVGCVPCERGLSVDEPDAVDFDPAAALNAFADP
jgi:hypothetical protein